MLQFLKVWKTATKLLLSFMSLILYDNDGDDDDDDDDHDSRSYT